MRIISYAVLNTETKERFNVGCSHLRAEAMLEVLQSKNPNANFKIVYKFFSI